MSYSRKQQTKGITTCPNWGVAAININGTTIHSALKIPVGQFGKNVPQLSDKLRSSLRNKLL